MDERTELFDLLLIGQRTSFMLVQLYMGKKISQLLNDRVQAL